MTQNDPTDDALATIASILELGGANQRVERSPGASPSIAPVEADGYLKVGPGPMEAVRFKWTVRRAKTGEYFVDETIGDSSPSVVLGPLSADAAVKLVDQRESDARQRFEQIRSEMIGRVAAHEPVRRGGKA